MKGENRYLQSRDGWWHYVRRVPSRFVSVDTRGMLRQALKTQSLETARRRRDDMEAADELYWQSLTSDGPDIAQRRYESAVQRALALSLTYMSAEQLAATASTEDLVERVALARGGSEQVFEAALGTVDAPMPTIRQAFQVYLDEVAPKELRGKSENQRKNWIKVKHRAVNNFVALVGDKPINEITRDDARTFYRWWLERIEGEDGLSGSSGNRDVGNMRKIYRGYFAQLGMEPVNPFQDLSYKNTTRTIPPFETAWIRDTIMKPGVLAGMNRDARLICFAMIETGARPSEIANLRRDQIRLDHDVPHISIEFTEEREIKTKSSVREIPLTGVSLEAMRKAPDGFPRYRDKETNLSNALMKFFKANKLFPSEAHRIYSFRHSFEKRMTEAGLDYGLRCTLMGHATDRPAYGDGGSMEYRRDELLKLVLPVPDGLL